MNKKIFFKTSKVMLILGIILLILMTPLWGTFISIFFEQDVEPVAAIIIGLLGFMLLSFPTLGGVMAIADYFKGREKLRLAVQKYGKENLIKHIQEHSVSVYNTPMNGAKVYFTDKLVIDPGTAIIDYNEIVLMYKHVNRSRIGVASSVCFQLLDGTGLYLCKCIKDEEIQEYMQLCIQHNPKIMLGNTNENLRRSKELTKQFKSGEITVPELNIDRLNEAMSDSKEELEKSICLNFTKDNRDRAIAFYCEKTGVSEEEAADTVDKINAKRQGEGMELKKAWEWTLEGQQYMLGKRMFNVGILCCIFFIVTYIFMLIFTLPMSKEVPIADSLFLSTAIYWSVETLLWLMFFSPFLIISIVGKRKMKKYDRKDKTESSMSQSDLSISSGSFWH